MREGAMRRGSLAVTLHHAMLPSPSSKPNLNSRCSNQLLASIFFSCRTNKSIEARLLSPCALRCSRSVWTSSSSSIIDFVDNSSRRGCARFSEQLGGCSWLKNWRKQKSLRQSIWCTRDFESGRFGARAALATMDTATGEPPEGYRPNVGLCLINGKDEVFVASRLDIPDSWQMPQGGVDDGEEPRNAALRELREETGVTSVQLIGEVQEWLTYEFPPDVKAKITKLWGREWTGQAQKWFLFRFVGNDSEVNLAGEGTEPAEFGQWKWSPAEEVLKGAVEFKKPVYAKAFKSLAVYVNSWSKL